MLISKPVHRDIYRVRIASMEAGGQTTYKLGPEAVAGKLVHALESPHPNFATTSPFPPTPWRYCADPASGRPRRRGQAELGRVLINLDW